VKRSPPPPSPRREARFKDEIAALRAWYFDAPASMWIRSSMGRMLDRAEIATRPKGSSRSTLCYCGRTRSEHTREAEFDGQCTTFRPMTMHVASTAAPTGAKPREPDVDVTLNAVGRALARITETVAFQREEIVDDERFGRVRTGKLSEVIVPAGVLLVEAYISLGAKIDRSASEIAHAVRVAGDKVPTWIRCLRRGARFRWPAILADVHGSAMPEDDAQRVESAVRRARRALRKDLSAVELDSGARYLIAPMTTEELRDEAWRDTPAAERVTVVCCRGARVVDGILQPCETFESRGPADAHPSAAWRRCESCGRPQDSTARKAKVS